MSLRILIVPDKFKGTLSARQAALIIAMGWQRARPQDEVDLLPMSDGGDGFGEVLSGLIDARLHTVDTVDAAHRPIKAQWALNAKKHLAIVESARIIGLTMLPKGKFHPFQLDTFGLGKVLRTAARLGVNKCVVGIGGSATNDGGFGLAQALDWKFYARSGAEIREWWQLHELAVITRPQEHLNMEVVVAVDVNNPLLGEKGCSRVYGPQKGLRPEDLPLAEKCLNRLGEVAKQSLGMNLAKVPGAGAAGGLGFGLMAFTNAKCESGFELFSVNSQLEKRIQKADMVITGEGAIDDQTFMGKGVGRIVELCKKHKVPCLGLAGRIRNPTRAKKFFFGMDALVEE